MLLKNKLTILVCLLGFLMIICLTLFILWQGRRRPGVYACSPDDQCRLYPQPVAAELCPITFQSEDCNNQCGNPLNHCGQ